MHNKMSDRALWHKLCGRNNFSMEEMQTVLFCDPNGLSQMSRNSVLGTSKVPVWNQGHETRARGVRVPGLQVVFLGTAWLVVQAAQVSTRLTLRARNRQGEAFIHLPCYLELDMGGKHSPLEAS